MWGSPLRVYVVHNVNVVLPGRCADQAKRVRKDVIFEGVSIRLQRPLRARKRALLVSGLLEFRRRRENADAADAADLAAHIRLVNLHNVGRKTAVPHRVVIGEHRRRAPRQAEDPCCAVGPNSTRLTLQRSYF